MGNDDLPPELRDSDQPAEPVTLELPLIEEPPPPPADTQKKPASEPPFLRRN